MQYLAAWILTPLAILFVAFGCGLLVQRLLPAKELELGLLTLPVGLAAAIIVVSFPYALGLGSPAALVLLAAAALTGIVWSRGRGRDGLPDRWASLGALATYVLFIAPVALSGELTFAGYWILGDTSVHLALIDHVAQHGNHRVTMDPSSYASVVGTHLHVGYPLGPHYLLATIHAAVPVDIAWAYQPAISTIAAIAALAVMRLLRAAGVGRRASALAAVIVLGSNLVFSYAMQGGIKELFMVMLIVLAAVVAGESVNARSPRAHLFVFALAGAAAFAVYSAGGLPWFGLIALITLAVTAISGWGRLGRMLRAVPAALGAGLLLSLPALLQLSNFYSQGSRLIGSSEGSDVGNLLGSIKIWQVFGAWLVSDFRIAPPNPWPTAALIGAIIVIAGIGAAHTMRRRLWAPLFLLMATLLVWLIVPAGIYIEAKFLMLLAPAVAVVAIIGVRALYDLGRRFEAVGLVLLLAVAILASDAYSYRGMYLAPADRHAELQKIGQRFAGQGPALYLEFDEYGKHFLRKLDVNSALEGYTPRAAELLKPRPVYAGRVEPDELTEAFVESYRLLVLRRAPNASRSPSNFALAARYPHYDVWRRTGPPPLARMPLGDAERPAERPACTKIQRFAVRHRANARRLAFVPRRNPLALSISRMRMPAAWIKRDGTVYPVTPGTATGTFDLPAGRYRVWVRGSFGRGADVFIDGRLVGSTGGDLESPGGASAVGEVELGGGRSRIVLRRGGGSLAPANARGEFYSTVFIEPAAQPPVAFADIARPRSICGQPLDWVEALR